MSEVPTEFKKNVGTSDRILKKCRNVRQNLKKCRNFRQNFKKRVGTSDRILKQCPELPTEF